LFLFRFAALYPNGEDEASKDYVSCFLILVSNNSSGGVKDKEVRAHISFSFNGNRHRLYRESCNTFTIPKTNNWGWDNLDLSAVVDDLVDDTLNVHIEIEVISGWAASVSPIGPQVVMHKCSLLEDFQKMLSGSVHTDIIFNVNDESIPAHRAILSVRSPVFKSMFDSGMQESTKGIVNIRDIETVVFTEMLKYVYCGKCDEKILNEKVIEILAVADMYDINGLKLLCSDLLLSRMRVNSAAATLVAADTYLALELKQHALAYITKYFVEVFATDGFKDLCSKAPHLVVEIQESVALAINNAHSPAKSREDRDSRYQTINISNQKKKRKHDVS